jgi:hypothetical protein
VTATRSPSAAKRRAQASPMPREPPVTRTIRLGGRRRSSPRPSGARRWRRSCRRRSRRAARGRPGRCARRRGRRRARAGSTPTRCCRCGRGPSTCARAGCRGVAGGLDDADVGLVGDDEGDVVGGHAGMAHRLLGGVDHDPHGPAEDLLAVHLDQAADLGVEEPLAAEPSASRSQPSSWPGPSTASSTTAPAPSANRARCCGRPVGDAGERVGADERTARRRWRSSRGPRRGRT